jgi:hypothetical protein
MTNHQYPKIEEIIYLDIDNNVFEYKLREKPNPRGTVRIKEDPMIKFNIDWINGIVTIPSKLCRESITIVYDPN